MMFVASFALSFAFIFSFIMAGFTLSRENAKIAYWRWGLAGILLLFLFISL